MAEALPAPPAALVEAAGSAVAAARELGAPVLLAWGRRGDADLLRFLAAGDAPRLAFLGPGDEVAGRGEAVRLEAAGEGRFDAVRLQAEAVWKHAVLAGEPGAPGPRFLGGFAFDGRPAAAWEGFPPALFVLPRLALARVGGEGWATASQLVEGREEPAALARQLAVAAARAVGAQPALGPASTGVPLPPFGSQVVDREAWVRRVEHALQQVRRGELEKVVLARRVPVPLTAPLQGPEALARLGARYADCVRFLVEPRPGRAFLGATPELLVRARGREVESGALAGTAARGDAPGEDEALARALLASPKERGEHAIVVRHVRARLEELGAKVAAPAEPGVQKLANVQHLHTPIHAELPAPMHVLDLVAALHPTPAVAGAPPERALAFLARTEGFARGGYAGAVGWFDASGEGTFHVALRCALAEEREAWLFAGAGIVAGAEPGREWDETGLKLQPMLEALGCR
jgi:menaquinone-specific isochorismate synthase